MKIRGVGVVFTLVLFLSLSVISCSKASFSDGASGAAMAPAASPTARTFSKAASAQYAGRDMVMAEMEVAEESFASSSENGGGASVERKLIRNASLTVEVKNLEESLAAAEALAENMGGYVSNSDTSQTRVWLTLRIPAGKFDEAVSGAEAFGRLLSRSVSVDDVSEEYYDLDTRLQTRKILHEKLSGYLKQASSVEDLLEVERQLNDVQSEIESMEGRMRRLNDLIALSTINVTMQLPSYSETNHSGLVLPDLPGKFRETVSSILRFFSTLLMTVIVVIICGIPLVIAIGFLYWLSFGKLGLVKKLFAKLRGEK